MTYVRRLLICNVTHHSRVQATILAAILVYTLAEMCRPLPAAAPRGRSGTPGVALQNRRLLYQKKTA